MTNCSKGIWTCISPSRRGAMANGKAGYYLLSLILAIWVGVVKLKSIYSMLIMTHIFIAIYDKLLQRF